MISTKLRVATAAVMMLGAGAALAGPMVLRASGPSAPMFKAGQRLADGVAVALKTGDTLVVLDSRGTRSVAGPGSFRFDTASADAAPPTSFTDLLTQKSERRARIGAVRGGTAEPVEPPHPPGIWAIDTAAGGTVCILDAAQVSLWRADGTKPVTLAVSQGATKGDTPFAAGQLTAPWPASVSVTEGAPYTIAGFAKPVTVSVKLLQKPDSIEALATALIANGCTGQVERMARLTAVPG